MAKETVDEAIKFHDLKPLSESKTDGLLLEGGHTWTPTMFIRLIQDLGMDSEVAKHLAETYGDRAFSVGKMANFTGQRWPIVGKRLHEEYPYIEAEVRYACKEYAATAIDVVSKRLRLSFLNVQAAEEALPRIVDIMAEELKWTKSEKAKQLQDSLDFLKTEMGKDVNKASRENIPINLSKNEIKECVKRFNLLDRDKKGFVSINDIRQSLQASEESDVGKLVSRVLMDMELTYQGAASLEEFIQMMSAIKTGAISHNRFARMADSEEIVGYGKEMARSGGGV